MKKFYSRRGDDGTTSLLGEGRVPKFHPRIEANGCIDEASAAIGAARAVCRGTGVNDLLQSVQRDLYHIMAEIAATPENVTRFRKIDSGRVTWLEENTDRISATIGFPPGFILPGDTPASGLLSLARAVVRRAERRVAQLFEEGEVANVELQRYLNRLSSLCFALELLENHAAGVTGPTMAEPE
jgi:cob(I)alamin adenosyltransferase